VFTWWWPHNTMSYVCIQWWTGLFEPWWQMYILQPSYIWKPTINLCKALSTRLSTPQFSNQEDFPRDQKKMSGVWFSRKSTILQQTYDSVKRTIQPQTYKLAASVQFSHKHTIQQNAYNSQLAAQAYDSATNVQFSRTHTIQPCNSFARAQFSSKHTIEP
jgi:hypothetical protein